VIIPIVGAAGFVVILFIVTTVTADVHPVVTSVTVIFFGPAKYPLTVVVAPEPDTDGVKGPGLIVQLAGNPLKEILPVELEQVG
jgi:hypothetical protein